MAYFCCTTKENFMFSLKYCQQKVDLDTCKTSLAFVTIRHFKFHLYDKLASTKISYLHKNTHLRKDAAFLHFLSQECSETYEN